jgi:hypothetical protein
LQKAPIPEYRDENLQPRSKNRDAIVAFTKTLYFGREKEKLRENSWNTTL